MMQTAKLATKNFGKFASLCSRFIGPGTILFSILAIALGCIPVGIIGILCGAFMSVLEFPWPILAQYLNFLTDYIFRGSLYVVMSFPLFFCPATILAALCFLGVGVIFILGAFKNEKGTTVEYVKTPKQESPAHDTL
eukprot:TRINITY_DN5109_c0_g1_i1.p1 TRINITY_DN5109_c0_g1~~TRINITY_DN5109_c0_g1_i1.p1  ORF type:complete len:137 (-),score=13.02 TRINITY_DN5109_c0_g1_i1:22-432(-)